MNCSICLGEWVEKAEIAEGFYVAPKLRGEATTIFDVKSDIFSLGIMILDMLFAFKSGHEKAIVLGNSHQREQCLGNFSMVKEKKDLIKRLISLDPIDRPHS